MCTLWSYSNETIEHVTKNSNKLYDSIISILCDLLYMWLVIRGKKLFTLLLVKELCKKDSSMYVNFISPRSRWLAKKTLSMKVFDFKNKRHTHTHTNTRCSPFNRRGKKSRRLFESNYFFSLFLLTRASFVRNRNKCASGRQSWLSLSSFLLVLLFDVSRNQPPPVHVTKLFIF